MSQFKKYQSIWMAACIMLMSFVLQQKKSIKVYMIGDSTMSIKKPEVYPETGWGMELSQFFDKSVTVDNRAMNGRSTLSFQTENHWQPIVDHLQEGDYVIIEFAGNDEKVTKPGVGTTLEQFRDNLIKFVNDTRSKKAYPILMTPICRRRFKNGVVMPTHQGYPDVVRHVADSLKVPMVDMELKTKQWLQSLGDEPSKKFFNYVEPGDKNYPQGKKDNSHLNIAGARKVAAFAVEGIKELKLELAERLK
jgi:pectinesterase